MSTIVALACAHVYFCVAASNYRFNPADSEHETVRPLALQIDDGRVLYQVEAFERVFLLDLSANAALFPEGRLDDVAGPNSECHRAGVVTARRGEDGVEEEGWAAISDCSGLVIYWA